jgi:hypothetical protein
MQDTAAAPAAPAPTPAPPTATDLRADAERAEAEVHLSGCDYCRRRYRFEGNLRRYVRQAVEEPMPPELKQRLADLRIAL